MQHAQISIHMILTIKSSVRTDIHINKSINKLTEEISQLFPFVNEHP